MKNNRALLVMIAILPILSGCGGRHLISLGDVATLRRGMSAMEVDVLIRKQSKEQLSFQLDSGEGAVQVDVYRMSEGASDDSYYFIGFVNGKLVYWGYPHEFARIGDSTVNEIGKKAVDQMRTLGKFRKK